MTRSDLFSASESVPTSHSWFKHRLARNSLAIVVMAGCLSAIGCQSGGNFSLFGYSTVPPFDTNIRSVSIPVFKNTTFHTNPYRGVEVDITEEIVRELNARKSPIRVISDPARADTELIGTVTNITKTPQNRTPLNFIREYDVVIACQVVWRDNRTGRNLTGSRKPTFQEAPSNPFDPNREAPLPPPPDAVAAPITINGYGRVLPELGGSTDSGAKAAAQQIARQIVNMMEKPW